MLAAPQFYKNFVKKSTRGMSVGMVLMWTAGDLFKTIYFILRNSPTEFLVCGILQASFNLGVLLQVYMYKGRRVDVKHESGESDQLNEKSEDEASNEAFSSDESSSKSNITNGTNVNDGAKNEPSTVEIGNTDTKADNTINNRKILVINS